MLPYVRETSPDEVLQVLLRSRSASPVEDPVDTSHTSRRHSSSRSARSASHHSPSTFSPSFEQKAESPVPRRAPRPKPSPSFSHSSSSSSKLASTDGNGLGIENGHSPSPPIEQPRSGSSTNRRGSGPADIAANPNKSADEDLDERIRFAEEQIQRTHALQARRTLYPEQGISPEEATLRSRDARTLEFDSPAAASGSTLRRSGTTSSASARTPNGDSVYRDQTPEDSYVDEREKERSNGSGGGRLKPLPHSFRHGGFVSTRHWPMGSTDIRTVHSIAQAFKNKRIHPECRLNIRAVTTDAAVRISYPLQRLFSRPIAIRHDCPASTRARFGPVIVNLP